ncbi:MAG: YjjG family noncanonical pyrimidine nucleotidase [Prevotella sp.]|nr:YjjG family noncanonical pyrimidine nucleotidase [Prevotella sp.]
MEKKRYADLFIDFDDTLCDTHGGAQLALEALYDENGLDRYFDKADDFFDAYWRTNIELWQQYGKGEISRDFLIVERFRRPLNAGRGMEVTEQRCLQMGDRFLDLCVEKTRAPDGAPELVDYLRQKGYRLHLCSNGFHEVQYRKLHNCGFDGCFDTVVLSEDAGVNKPKRGYFDYAFRLTGARPETTVMIGDGWESDMRGALDYGLDTIYYNRFPDYPAPEPVTHEVHALRQIMEIL